MANRSIAALGALGLAMVPASAGLSSVGPAQAASRSFLAANADAVKQPTILGGSGAVSGAADRAVQEALGLR